MSMPRAIGLVLMAVGVCAYGTAPDWLALSVGLIGLAVTLFADARYLRRAIARRHFSFLLTARSSSLHSPSGLLSECGDSSAQGHYELQCSTSTSATTRSQCN